MILFSDLHLRPESEAVCRSVLDSVHAIALERRDPVIAGLGDWWHGRYALPVHLLNLLRGTLHSWTRSGMKVHVLPGNHDQYEAGGRHALEVFADIPGVVVHTEPEHDSATGTWLPYRRDPRQLLDWLAANPQPSGTPPVAFLHHGIVGASMNNGIVAGETDGLRPDDLSAFRIVFCGHWHRHQQVRQCVYVGSQWQTRADEAGQVKGVIHFASDGTWQFVPVDVGRKFHKVRDFSASEVSRIRAGDAVRVPAGTGKQVIDALRALGADVFSEDAAPQTSQEVRVDTTTDLRQAAEKYAAAQQLPEGFDVPELMRVFDEVRDA